jgi:hypothetical protein
METLKKNTIEKISLIQTKPQAGCCGGAPATDASACCKLDEEKKAEGHAGCGCNSEKVVGACC